MIKKRIYLSIIIFLFLTVWCFGYVDPGIGNYLIQVILAAFVGASLAIKIFWGRIRLFFGKVFSKEKKESVSSNE